MSESTGTTWHSEHGICQAGAAGELKFMELMVETAEFKGSRFSAGAWDRTETTPAPGRNVEEGNWAGRLGDPLVVRKDRGLCGRTEAAGCMFQGRFLKPRGPLQSGSPPVSCFTPLCCPQPPAPGPGIGLLLPNARPLLQLGLAARSPTWISHSSGWAWKSTEEKRSAW